MPIIISLTAAPAPIRFMARNWLAPAKLVMEKRIVSANTRPVFLESRPKAIDAEKYPIKMGIPDQAPSRKIFVVGRIFCLLILNAMELYLYPEGIECQVI